MRGSSSSSWMSTSLSASRRATSYTNNTAIRSAPPPPLRHEHSRGLLRKALSRSARFSRRTLSSTYCLSFANASKTTQTSGAVLKRSNLTSSWAVSPRKSSLSPRTVATMKRVSVSSRRSLDPTANNHLTSCLVSQRRKGRPAYRAVEDPRLTSTQTMSMARSV